MCEIHIYRKDFFPHFSTIEHLFEIIEITTYLFRKRFPIKRMIPIERIIFKYVFNENLDEFIKSFPCKTCNRAECVVLELEEKKSKKHYTKFNQENRTK